MDVEKWKGALQKLFSKERGMKGLIFLGICGIALIYLSTLLGSGKEKQSAAGSETAACTAAEYEKNLEREIVRIVGAITGETDPAVMVTLKSGSRYVYAMEERRFPAGSGRRKQRGKRNRLCHSEKRGGRSAGLACYRNTAKNKRGGDREQICR